MPDYVPCHGCRAPLHILSDVCSVCGRQLDDAQREARHEEILRRRAVRLRLPRLIACWLLLGAVAAWAYPRRGPIVALLQTVRAEFTRRMNAAASAPMPGKPLSPRAIWFVGVFLPFVPDNTVVAPPLPPPPPAPKPVVAHPTEPPRSPHPPSESKRVYGVVYDIATVFPVAGARLSFVDSRGSPYEISTDASGRYHIDLPGACMGVAYSVAAAASGYRKGQIEDTDPPYFEKTAEQRGAALEQLTPSDMTAFSLRCRASARVVELGIVLVSE
jgi:hypothetical protein